MMKAEGSSIDPVRSALDLLADFQASVNRSRARGPDQEQGLIIDADTFEYVTGHVAPELGALRKVLGARLDFYDLQASALPSPRGGAWFLRLEDSKGQWVDFRVDRNDLSEVRAYIHDNAGLPDCRVVLATPEAIQQLGRLVAQATVNQDFKSDVPLAARYVGDVRRALVPAAKKQTARSVMALNNVLQGASQGHAADMEKLITAYIECGFSFRKFDKVYGDSDAEQLSLEFSDKNGNEVQFTIQAERNDDKDRIVNYKCSMTWSIREQKANAAAPNNVDDINEWFRQFQFVDPGSNSNTGGTRTGSKSLDKVSEKKFAVELMNYAKNRKWITPDLSKGSLGRFLKL